MSTIEGKVSEAPFSDLISRWLEEGDRLSEETTIIASGPGARVAEERETLLARARARAKRHPAIVSALGGALVVLGVSLLRSFAQSHMGAPDAVAAQPSAPSLPVAAVRPPPPQPAVPAAAADPKPSVLASDSDPSPAAPAFAPQPTAPASTVSATDPKPTTVPAREPAAEARPPATPVAAVASVPPTATPSHSLAPPKVSAQPLAAARPHHASAPSRHGLASGSSPASGSVPGRLLPSATGRAEVSALGPAPAHAPAPTRTIALATPLAPTSERQAATNGMQPAPVQTCETALEKERTRIALAACQQVADAQPNSADAIVLLAQAELLAGREGDSLRLARRAQAINPRCADAYLLIGNVEQLTGRRPNARTAYEAYLQLAPRGRHAADVRAILRRL